MYVTFAPESLSAFRIFFAPRPGSITAASKLASSMRRYALLRSGGTENVETRIWGEETSAVHKPAVVQLAFDRILLPRTPFHSWGSIQDRKSTRLNSSHGYISYAVFCLKK